MNPLTVDDLGLLVGEYASPCISLLMPTHRAHPDSEQDPIRYRNLLKQIEDELGSWPDSKALLRPLRELDEPTFWKHQMGGLVVYRSSDHAAHYRLPDALPERASVGDRFLVKPLLPFLQSNHCYYVLALSQNDVALFQGTATGLSRLEPASVPSSIREALGQELHIRHHDYHPVRRGSAHISHHGHGGPDEAKKDDLTRFFREVEKGLWSVLRRSRAPLVLVGVDYYHPLFRAVCRYPHLMEEGVIGNYEHAAPEELHELTWPVVETVFRQREEEAVNEVAARLPRRRATTELEPLGRAVGQGRVQTLLLAQNGRRWGVFSPETGQVSTHTDQRPGSQDLMEELAQGALQRGGEVLVVPQERLPSSSPWAATFRW